MNKLLTLLVALPAIVFVVGGVRWVVDPSGAAASLGMPLLEGVGLSSQVGDVGSFFLSVGIMMLLALITRRRSWFYAPVLLLAMAALLRILAWLLQDAALALPHIAFEVLVACVLLIAATRLQRED